MPVGAWLNWSGDWGDVARRDAAVNLGTWHVSASDALNHLQTVIRAKHCTIVCEVPRSSQPRIGQGLLFPEPRLYDSVPCELFGWLTSNDTQVCLPHSPLHSVLGKTKLKPCLWVLNRAGVKCSQTAQLLPRCKERLCVHKYHTAPSTCHTSVILLHQWEILCFRAYCFIF